MEALRIVASRDEQGSYEFNAYDAEELFTRANEDLDAGRCAEAVALYDQLVREFATSKYASASLYNAGLCLAQVDDKAGALSRFEALIRDIPASPDVKHASLQAVHLTLALARFDEAKLRADALLARTDLDAPERVEAMALRAQALLGLGEREEAYAQAEQALKFHRLRAAELTDPYYVAAANFVLAEALRLRGESMVFPATGQDAQRAVLVARAQILLDAQRAYFDTIRHTSAFWASAAGHRIGAMYDTLWHDIMKAPVPETLSEAAKREYPKELAKLVKPLLRHAVRYWELTLMMVERTGVQSEWAAQTQADLARTRALLLDQPAGPGGLPAPVPSPTSTPIAQPPSPPEGTPPSPRKNAAGSP